MNYKKTIKDANPSFIHHRPGVWNTSTIREVVFGMEDGMVSTMGAITGIAAGTGNHYVVVLSGLVIISVESISMAVGSYLSNKSEKEIDERKLHEESVEIRELPEEEKIELVEMYRKDGWPAGLSNKMAEAASQDKDLFLKEMAYRELEIIPGKLASPFRNGLAMGVSYIIGGSIPLLPYLFLPLVRSSLVVSVGSTLIGLFILGVLTTKYSHRKWWKAGLEMLLLASVAGGVGFGVGQLAEKFFLK